MTRSAKATSTVLAQFVYVCLWQKPSDVLFNGTTKETVENDKETSGKEQSDDSDKSGDEDECEMNVSQSQQPGEDEYTEDWSRVLYWDLPEWLRDNELITTGHRPQIHSFYSCLLSVFSVHSETGNIWTHLIGQPIIT